MLGRELDGGRAVDGIDAGGEDGDGGPGGADGAAQVEIDERAFAAADPVLLHDLDLLGPTGELFEIAQQLIGILGDAEKPLLEFALLDWSIFVPPAVSAYDLLVRQHGAALWTPVHLALLAVRHILFEELQEEPLVPAVVIGEAGGDFARPVVSEAETLHLRFHRCDVLQSPLARGSVVFDGGIFSGQAEGIPAHGMKHVVAVHPHVACEGVADGVVAHVPHVQRAGRVGKHLEDVILGLGGVRLGGVELGIAQPARGPLLLDALRVVALIAGGTGVVFFGHRVGSGMKR